MSKEAKKVGVIGAGIIGIVVASCLQRGGHEVFVVDPNEPGKGASFGNAGIFGTSSVVPMSLPGSFARSHGGSATRSGCSRYVGAIFPSSRDGWSVIPAPVGRKGPSSSRALSDMLGRAVDNLAPLVEAAEATIPSQRNAVRLPARSTASTRFAGRGTRARETA